MLTLPVLISLALNWVLFFWLWRDYRLDLCRERLFTIRQSLFDMALDGELDFDSPAYGMLRSTINGTIQFAHRLSLLEFCAFIIASRGSAGKKMATSYCERMEKACKGLAPEKRRRLDMLRGMMHFEVFEQLVMTSAILMFTLISLVFVVVLVALKRHVQDAVKRLLSGTPIGRIAASFDSTVFTQAA